MLIDKFLNQVYKNNLEDIKAFLLSHPIDINSINYSGDTALTMAIRNKNQPLVKYLIEHKGAQINLKQIDLLSHAITCENIEAIHYLTQDNLFFKPLEFNIEAKRAAINTNNRKMLELVFEDKNFTVPNNQMGYLTYAINHHNAGAIDFFINQPNYNIKETYIDSQNNWNNIIHTEINYSAFIASIKNDNEKVFKNLFDVAQLGNDEKKELFQALLKIYQSYNRYEGNLIKPKESYFVYMIEKEKQNLNLLRNYFTLSNDIQMQVQSFQHFNSYIEAAISTFEKDTLNQALNVETKNDEKIVKQKSKI